MYHVKAFVALLVAVNREPADVAHCFENIFCKAGLGIGHKGAEVSVSLVACGHTERKYGGWGRGGGGGGSFYDA